jgi:hypothetical protein
MTSATKKILPKNEGRNQERLRPEMQLVRLRTMPHRQRANYKNQVSRYPNRGRDSGLRGDLPSDQGQTRQDQKSKKICGDLCLESRFV